MAYTNTGLVAYCKGCLGLPYIYATYGNKLTESVLNRSYSKYPKYWSEARYNKAKKSYIGKKVQDCTGLVEGYLMGSTPKTFTSYDGNVDRSANGWLAASPKKGTIGTIPEVPGIGVHYDGHMGVYIGGGYVIEARGFDYGVVKTKLSARGWESWFYIKGIDYSTKVSTSTSSASYFPKYSGSTTSIVDALNKLGIKSTFSYRRKIAKANSISLYVGTAKQNTNLLNLLKKGKLKRP